jgi:hypothetical protein
MKVIIWPVILFVAGLLIAHFFFGLNVERLLEGFGDFVAEILDGPG